MTSLLTVPYGACGRVCLKSRPLAAAPTGTLICPEPVCFGGVIFGSARLMLTGFVARLSFSDFKLSIVIVCFNAIACHLTGMTAIATRTELQTVGDDMPLVDGLK